VIKKNSRRVFVVAATLLALSLVAQPALAETIVGGPTGNISDYEVYDMHPGEKGAHCLYEAGNYDLDRINVRPPQVHGDHSNKTWVGWRFRILRSTNSGSSWNVVHTSSIQKDRANNAIPADGFTRRGWAAPENPTGWFLVRIQIFWYVPGSMTNVAGKVAIEYDWYKAKWSTFSYPQEAYCTEYFVI